MNNALLLDNWTVIEVEKSARQVTFWASYDIEPESCQKCGTLGLLYRWGSKTSIYTDVPHLTKPTRIHVDLKRYKCRACRATFMQPLPDMMPRRLMTTRCHEYIMEQSLLQPTIAIARNIGVDEKLCRVIQRQYLADTMDDRRPYAPQVLGIDEVTLMGKARAIFTDILGRRVLDLLEDRSKSLVYNWLSWLPDRERIRYVTIDMWEPYKDAVADLPNTNIIVVVDKFHVLKKANFHLDRIRVEYARSRPSLKQKRAVLRGRLLLQKSRHRLSAKQRLLLQGWLANAEPLQRAWAAKEAFYDCWATEDRAEAERRFDAWKRDCIVDPEFGKLANTIDDWREQIFAYFDTKLTNAYTEAANGILRVANRLGRGYSLDVLRARIVSRDPTKDSGTLVCESCLGLFPKPYLTKHNIALWNAKTGVWPGREALLLCPNCHRRIHTEEVNAHRADSTR